MFELARLFNFFLHEFLKMRTKKWPVVWSGLLALLIAPSLRAFPPAPHHLLFGTVRDEMGNPLAVQGAEVILETPAGTSIKAQIIPGLDLSANYRLAVPLDAGVTSDIYKPTAQRTTAPFKLRVRIGTLRSKHPERGIRQTGKT